MKRILPILLLCTASTAAAQPETTTEPRPPGTRWSLLLGGGALAPIGDMRAGYQDALVAGARLSVRARVGIGIQLAVDYSPLPRREVATETFDTSYGTVAIVPAWTIGQGTVRVQVGAGGGLALEHVSVTSDADERTTDDTMSPAALAQVGLELHVTQGGGLVVLGGATRTFGEREYQYAWGMGGLTLEF